jgi:tetratricopeptide (TPR) repeat protein
MVAFFLSFSLSLTAQEIKGEAIQGKDDRGIYFEAAKQKVLGNYDKALELFQQYAEKYPEDAASYYEMADIHSIKNEPDKAIEMAEKAVKLDGANKWYKIMLFQLYQERSRFDDAGMVIAQLLESEPGNIEYIQEAALNHIYNGDLKEAIKIYDSLEDKIGVTEEVSQQKHRIYLLMGKMDKAIEEIEALSNAFPERTRYLEMLAELYMSSGETKKALEIYEKILVIDPENPYINISLSDYYRKTGDDEKSFEYLRTGFANPSLDIDTKVQILLAYYTVNEIYSERKEEAFTLAELMVGAHPREPKAWSIYADLLYQDDRLEEAENAFEKVLVLDSSKYLVWEQLLFVESEMNDFNAMADLGERAIQLFPQQPLLYLFAGAGRFQQKKYDRAAEHFSNGVRFTVSNNKLLEQFYSYLGDAYFQLEDHAASDEAYENALKINPKNSLVLNNYAYYLSLRKENLEKAEQMAKMAVELDPDNSSNQDTYGWVLFQLERYEEAREWIAKAMEDEEESAVVVEHYGDVLWKLGEMKEAVKYWEKALKMGEGSEFLEKKVELKQYLE